MVAQEQILFENEEWAVLDSGLEHKRTGYFIARDEITDRRSDGLWTWPLHLAEKTWCAMPAFMEAFSCATAVYGTATDVDLARSFQVARREIARWPDCAAAQPPQAAPTGARAPLLGAPPERNRTANPARQSTRPAARPRFGHRRRAAPLAGVGAGLARLLRTAWTITRFGFGRRAMS